MNDNPFANLAWSNLRRGMACLRSDISQQRQDFLVGCANALGNRTGNWCYEVIRAALLSANDPRQELPWRELERAQDFELLGHSAGEVPLWSESGRPFDRKTPRSPREDPCLGSPLPEEGSLSALLLGEFLSWLVRRHTVGWSWLAAPVAATAVSWLLRKISSPCKELGASPSSDSSLPDSPVSYDRSILTLELPSSNTKG